MTKNGITAKIHTKQEKAEKGRLLPVSKERRTVILRVKEGSDIEFVHGIQAETAQPSARKDAAAVDIQPAAAVENPVSAAEVSGGGMAEDQKPVPEVDGPGFLK